MEQRDLLLPREELFRLTGHRTALELLLCSGRERLWKLFLRATGVLARWLLARMAIIESLVARDWRVGMLAR